MDDTSSVPPARRKRRILGLDDQQRQGERRRLLLGAALELFGTRGYARTSIELLCQTAGIGTNSFYELFPNKEAVMIGLYDQLAERFEQAVLHRYLEHRAEADPIHPMVSAFVHEAVDDPRVARVAFIESAGISADVEEHRRRVRNTFIDGLQAIGSDIRQAYDSVPDEQVRDRLGPGSRRNAVAVVGAIVEMTLDWLLDPEPDPIEDLIDDIAHHCRRVVLTAIQEVSDQQTAARQTAVQQTTDQKATDQKPS